MIMSNIQIYVDGSATKMGKVFQIAWGFIALHNDQSIEVMGRLGKLHPSPQHETIAFIEAYLYAKSHGFAAENMSFFTDDEMIGHAQFFLHPGNKRQDSAAHIKGHLTGVCRQHFPTVPDLRNELVHCLQTSRFTKLKGHRNTVYNLRADYLAKMARGDEPIKSFEEWLAQGHLAYTADGPFKWLSPFARMQSQQVLQ